MGKNEDKFVSVETAWNISNMIKLRDHFKELAEPKTKKLKVGFNMWCFAPQRVSPIRPDVSGHECGTVCCLAGHAAILGKYIEPNAEFNPAIGTFLLTDFVKKWLGLNEKDFSSLCRNSMFWGFDIGSVRPKHIVKVLDFMINTCTMPKSGFSLTE